MAHLTPLGTPTEKKLALAIAALKQIEEHSVCPDPASGGCMGEGCAFETARAALRAIDRIPA